MGEGIPERLDETGIEVEEKWDYDDCLLCQLMKEAEEQGKNLTSEETKESFLKAKEKGHIVGGEWFEE